MVIRDENIRMDILFFDPVDCDTQYVISPLVGYGYKAPVDGHEIMLRLS